MAYQDNGRFHVLIFTNSGEILEDLEVQEICGLDQLSQPIDGFYEPLITVAFITDEVLYV